MAEILLERTQGEPVLLIEPISKSEHEKIDEFFTEGTYNTVKIIWNRDVQNSMLAIRKETL